MLKNKLLYVAILLSSLFNSSLSAQSISKTIEIVTVKTGDFRYADIGTPYIKGTVKNIDDGFDITAGGADIWGTRDEFGFVYIGKEGDFDFAARIDSVTAAHLYTKAGLMAREDLTPGSRHIFFQVFPDNKPRNKNNGGFEFQYRQAAGAEMKAIYPPKSEGTPDFPATFPDTWIRLKRSGDTFTGYAGTDGKTWKEFASFTLDLPGKIYLGAAVTSHNTKEPATGKFRDLGFIKK